MSELSKRLCEVAGIPKRYESYKDNEFMVFGNYEEAKAYCDKGLKPVEIWVNLETNTENFVRLQETKITIHGNEMHLGSCIIPSSYDIPTLTYTQQILSQLIDILSGKCGCNERYIEVIKQALQNEVFSYE